MKKKDDDLEVMLFDKSMRTIMEGSALFCSGVLLSIHEIHERLDRLEAQMHELNRWADLHVTRTHGETT